MKDRGEGEEYAAEDLGEKSACARGVSQEAMGRRHHPMRCQDPPLNAEDDKSGRRSRLHDPSGAPSQQGEPLENDREEARYESADDDDQHEEA